MNILDLMSFFLPPWGRITRVGIDRPAIGYTPDPPASPAAARAVSGHASEAALLSETINFRLPMLIAHSTGPQREHARCDVGTDITPHSPSDAMGG